MDDKLFRKRHSYGHVLAQAVLQMFPEAKLGTGPAIDTGFYYDFDLPRTLIPEDLAILEDKMKEIIKAAQAFEYYEEPADKAIQFLRAANQPYKVEIVEDLVSKQGVKTVSFYKNGDHFVDLCEGPHVENTRHLDPGAFTLDKISSAYWRADETRESMQRIYGLAFDNKKDLKEFIKNREEARKRDHKVLGPQLKLFTQSPLVGAGLPLLQPKGAMIKQLLQDYLWELHKPRGYQRVWTPHLTRSELFHTSGHYDHYIDDMFVVHGKSSEEEFCVKPMSCPFHMQIFADNQFSYRDMPVRYFEPATVYRDEKSGQLGGLTRVRSLTQDDGHLFCRVSQIKQEVASIVEVIKEFYTTMGMISDYWVRLSTRDGDRSKWLGSDEVWDAAESALEAAAKEQDLLYLPGEGEAAFYGPKLDFMFKDCLGREWQLATIQCDFNMPERFDLSFINEKGEKERPVVIHRAISGSLERFMGVMIEHFAGAFPTWLAPVQIALLPVAAPHEEYADKLKAELALHDIRVEILPSDSDSLGKRIRAAEMQKIPYMVVLGDKEIESGNLSVRSYKTKEQSEIARSEWIESLVKEVKERVL